MDNEVMFYLTSGQLANALNLRLVGPDLVISSVKPFSDLVAGALSFSKKPLVNDLVDLSTVIVSCESCLGVASGIISDNPRLDFARALEWINNNGGFLSRKIPQEIHDTVSIGSGVVIGNGVKIGANTVIRHNVVIGDGVVIGEGCVIKSGAVIGEDGFGFEKGEDGVPIRIVHLGGVVIGNNVEIGSLSTICRGTLSNTVIQNNVKIDDHVFIAHNCFIKKNSMIIACAEISGGVVVGENVWVGPNSSVIQKVQIGDNGFVGIGSNVTKNVSEGAIVAGNPARPLNKVVL